MDTLKYRPTHIFFILLLFVLPMAGIGQGIEITGKIIDQETRQSLPFASIQIEKTSMGTSANGEGYFQLIVPQTFADRSVLVSYIGYTPYRIQLTKLSPSSTILLKAEARQLREVVIMPDSSLFVFLRQAYNSIQNNYPDKPYELEGFYRESLKTVEGKYLYFGEAQLQVQGSGYQFSKEPGTVKVVKSRINNFPQQDTATHVGYYGGAFSGVAGDLIKKKSVWLRPDKKNYDYELLEVTSNEGKEVWVVGFTKKDGDVQGKLFIEKDSKAYLRTEVTRNSGDSLDNVSLSRLQTIKATSRTFYKKVGERWFLHYRDHQKIQFNKQLKKNTAVTTEFSVSKIKADSLSVIPFAERLGYTEVFSQLENNFTDDFWQGTTTLIPDSVLQSQVNQYQSQEKRNELINYVPPEVASNSANAQKITRFLRHLGYSIGVQYLPYVVHDTQLSLTYLMTSASLNLETTINSVGLPLLLATEFSFRLNNRWTLLTGSSSDFSSNYNFESRTFGLRYTMQLNRRGSPLMLRPSVEYGSQFFAISFPEFRNYEGIEFNGKQIDTKKLQFQVGERVRYGRLVVSLEKKLSGLKWIYLSAGYFVEIEKQNRLYLKDESGFFLFRNTRSASLSESGANVLINNQPMPNDLNWFNNLYFNAGLRLLF